MDEVPPPAIPIKLVWGALVIGVCAYPAVAYWMNPATFLPPSWPNPMNLVELGVMIAAITTLVLGFVLPPALARALPTAPPGAPTSPRAPRSRQPLVLLMRYALFEAPALMGFVLAFTTGISGKCLPFSVVALAALLMSPPTDARLGETPAG